MSKELQIVLPTTAIEIYSCDSIETIISAVEKEARSIVPDLTTDKGRKAIATNARKVSTSKVTLDNLGKDLVSGWKEKSKAVDAERRVMRDRFDSLRDEIRQPLTDYESKIAAEAAAKIVALKLAEDHTEALAENSLFDREREIARKETEQARIKQDRIDKEQAERAEAERIEYEARIAREAEEKAQREAQEAAERAERKAAEKIEAAEAAAKQAEREKIEAEQRAKIQAEQAEQERLDAIERGKVAAENAERMAIESAERARQSEINRQAKEKQAAEEKQARLEANKRHVGKIRSEAKSCLMEFQGIDETLAKRIVLAISRGEVKHITINY